MKPVTAVPSRSYHHGDLYETLVKAGTDLLVEQGLEGFTLRECARRAGVSHAAPKNHFASVEDLLCEIAARGFERFVTELDATAGAGAQDADSRLMAMGRAYVAFARAHPHVYGLMFRRSAGPLRSEHLGRAMMAAWAQLETAVRAVIGPARRDVAARAAQVWALVHGLSSLIIDGKLPSHITPDDVIAASLATLPAAIRGLGGA